MRLLSPAFSHQGKIPKRYTCEGGEHSPPLHFEGVPKEAKSLVLIMDDTDVPKSLRSDGMWDHWLLFNILPDVISIEEDRPPLCKSGLTTSNHTRYAGPCPPDREHRYFFKLYALDIVLNFVKAPTKEDIEAAIQGHIIESAILMGRYDRSGH